MIERRQAHKRVAISLIHRKVILAGGSCAATSPAEHLRRSGRRPYRPSVNTATAQALRRPTNRRSSPRCGDTTRTCNRQADCGSRARVCDRASPVGKSRAYVASSRASRPRCKSASPPIASGLWHLSGTTRRAISDKVRCNKPHPIRSPRRRGRAPRPEGRGRAPSQF